MTVADWARLIAPQEFNPVRDHLVGEGWTTEAAEEFAAEWVAELIPDTEMERLRYGAIRTLLQARQAEIEQLWILVTLGVSWVEEYQQRIADGSDSAVAARETVALAGRTVLRCTP